MQMTISAVLRYVTDSAGIYRVGNSIGISRCFRRAVRSSLISRKHPRCGLQGQLIPIKEAVLPSALSFLCYSKETFQSHHEQIGFRRRPLGARLHGQRPVVWSGRSEGLRRQLLRLHHRSGGQLRHWQSVQHRTPLRTLALRPNPGVVKRDLFTAVPVTT
ncbi:hypothetical protein CDAR_181101 [Caerostris darwini]|uniref:Uncharacterized protein n=1 Tax=Caerostris darwini TaxID=1538125 RepID=A0AAV4U3V6_9ARAC|nr:hypothetical protein CDAR_181101 [Caerostris darwini]